MKRILSTILITLFLIGCAQVPEVAATLPPATSTPEAETPIVLATPRVVETPIPMPTATPEPTPTPSPTPEPTPTPIPYDAALEESKRKALLMDQEGFHVVTVQNMQPSLYSELGENAKYLYPYKRMEGVYRYEFLLLDTVERNGNSYNYLRAIGADVFGYMIAGAVTEPRMQAPESTYAVLVRPNGLVYRARTLDSTIVAHADYDVVRVLGVDAEFACIVTSEGKSGYVELGQIQYLGKEQFETYLHKSCERPECTFDRETICDSAMEYVDRIYADSAEMLYDLLTESGLQFNEVYYRFYQKPLENESLYPQKLYIQPYYNSLTFKLFNSSGMEVHADGNETEWAYIDTFEAVEPGDLLFFADTYAKGVSVVPDVEVVLHGRYSGDITGCGLYVGDGQMLTVDSGRAVLRTISDLEIHAFDSARRIYTSVTDERAHFIENMISMIYDRLGTPYMSGKRVGDASYDCSGIISWVFRSFDYDTVRNQPGIPIEITATAYGHLEVLYSPTTNMTFVDTGIGAKERDRLTELQRGDFVLLLNERRTKIGHIMVYLGNNTVIHSTRIEGKYRGTLVAQFRMHLKYLYASSRRIEAIKPIN